VDEHPRENSAWVKKLVEVARPAEPRDPLRFRAALLDVPPRERDACLDAALEIGPPPEDSPELPRGCVPYLPCSVDALLRVAAQAPVRASDVFIDVGAGIGRAAVLMHLLTGARVVGLEVQPALIAAARELVARLHLPAVSFIEGDAVEQAAALGEGSVFFLYCPFSGARLVKLLEALEPLTRRRTICICCVDLRLPPCRFLSPMPQQAVDLTIYRSKLLDGDGD
jgi:SAM-dependent methyltransferase